MTYKKRPVLVVQDEAQFTGLRQRIVAGITSNLARTGPTRVTIRRSSLEGRAMGLRYDSVVMTDNLVTVLDREVDRVIGRCRDMSAIEDALRKTLGL
jgi:mRNA interferase MazF